MPLDKSKIKKVLVISLTNIGDVVLTFPVIDILKEQLPEAKLSVVIGPKAETLFNENKNLDKVYIFDKHQPSIVTIKWIMQLRKEKFDLVVDLRNTAIPFMVSPRYKTSFFVKKNECLHMKKKHLNRLKSIFPFKEKAKNRFALDVSEKEKAYVHDVLNKEVGEHQPFVVMAPGAASQDKRWVEEGFAQVADQLIEEQNVKVVMIGDIDDRKVAQRISKLMVNDPVNLCGRTDLLQLAELMSRSMLAIVNDSAPMHIASYVNIPVLAIFISTDPKKYGPWSQNCHFLTAPAPSDEKKEETLAEKLERAKEVKSKHVLDSIEIVNSMVRFIKNE